MFPDGGGGVATSSSSLVPGSRRRGENTPESVPSSRCRPGRITWTAPWRCAADGRLAKYCSLTCRRPATRRVAGRRQVSEQYFASRPSAAHRQGAVHVILPGLHLELGTDSGVFSPRRLDPGTRLLLDVATPPPPSGNILDLGCGYGPLALVAAARAGYRVLKVTGARWPAGAAR